MVYKVTTASKVPPFHVTFIEQKLDVIRLKFHGHTGAIDIGLGNGFVLSTREQALTWTNDDPAHWCMYVSLGLFVSRNLSYHTVGGLKRVFQPTNFVI